MNDQNAFSKRLQEFFLEYLPKAKGSSENTIIAYKYAFIAFFRLLKEKYDQSAADFRLDQFKYETINDFLIWSVNNKVSDATRNQRQAAINSFAKFLINSHPELNFDLTRIINIPVKKAHHNAVTYIKLEGIDTILKQVDRNSLNGTRDYLILTLMSILGLRVSEVISLRVSDISFAKPPSLLVTGKGNKQRYVPLTEKLINAIDAYFNSCNLGNISDSHRLLFPSRNLTQMTRQNLSYIVDKYANLARESLKKLGQDFTVIPEKVTPHMLRHSAAMNMLHNNNVSLLAVKDILGHTSLKATEVYVQATREEVQKAIDNITNDIFPEEKPEWGDLVKDKTIEDWLYDQLKNRNKIK